MPFVDLVAEGGWTEVTLNILFPHGVDPADLADNCAVLTDPADDPNGNNDDCAPFVGAEPVVLAPMIALPPGPDLAIDKTGPAQCDEGGTCTYTVTITNNGPGSFSGPLHVQDLPAGVDGVSLVGSSAGWTCTASGNLISCDHGPVDLGPGESLTLDITLQLPDDIRPEEDLLTNCSWLSEGGVVAPQLEQQGRLRGRRTLAETLSGARLSGLTKVAAAGGPMTPIPGYRIAQAGKAAGATSGARKRRGLTPNRLRRDRVRGNNRDCAITRIVQPGKPRPPPRLVCPPGWKTFSSASRIPKGWQRRTLRKDKQVVYCGKPRPG